MDGELRMLSAMGRSLPPMRGTWRIADRLRRLYCRKPRPQAEALVHGSVMRLDPANWLEGLYLFAPQLTDSGCMRFIQQEVGEGDVFVDCGSYVGFYALFASHLVGDSGRVVAIEAAPETYRRLTHNVGLNTAGDRIDAHNLGISDRKETLELGREEASHDSGHSFMFPERSDSVAVECLPLDVFAAEIGLEKIDFLKLDVEGFEYRILNRLFDEAAPSLRPRFVQVEQLPHEDWVVRAGGDALGLLERSGYVRRLVDGRNFILERRP